ncbi:MAG: adenylate kinase [Candidatus Nitrosopelagicus sp.]|nr:MAG: adenylate kinase [Candidatus Nitrosopelagicus sp.]
MVDRKKVVIVGIPGVGKTSLVTRIVELLNGDKQRASVHSYGTVMMNEAENNNISDRDNLRHLPVSQQKELQKQAAKKISELTDDVIFIDTHAFISTQEGFYPGLPNHVIQVLEPTHLIAISARPEEIYNRRMKDDTRNRDKISIEAIKKELAVQDAMLSSCSVLSGSPMKVILNNEGKIDEAAQNVIEAIGV